MARRRLGMATILNPSASLGILHPSTASVANSTMYGTPAQACRHGDRGSVCASHEILVAREPPALLAHTIPHHSHYSQSQST